MGQKLHINWGSTWRSPRSVCLFFLVLIFALSAAPVSAHKVTIFAWVEGDTVHTRSKFSGGKRAKNSTVVVYDKEGNLLLEGKTNDQGEFSFKVPKKTGFKVALKASMGHLAEWTIPASDLTAVGVTTEAGTEKPDASKTVETVSPSPSLTDTGSVEVAQSSERLGLSREEVKTLINEALDKKLAPVMNMLAESMQGGPKMSEVMGGIGYIFGLVGVILYGISRRGKHS